MGGKKKKEKPKSMKEYKQEFLPPAKLKTNPDYPVKHPDLVVAGHKVTPREAAIFCLYYTSHDSDLVCKEFGMTRQNLWDMTKRQWWVQWNLDQLKDWMDTARNRWLANGHKLIQAQADFLEDPDAFPQGYGQAIAKMIDTFLRASPEGIRPTLVAKFEHEFQADIRGSVDININITPDKIKKLTPEQIDDWNRTGVMPEELTEILGEPVDVDFEEVDEDDQS